MSSSESSSKTLPFQTLFFSVSYRKFTTTSQILQKLPCVGISGYFIFTQLHSHRLQLLRTAERANLSPRKIFLHKTGFYEHNQVVFAFLTWSALKHYDWTFNAHIQLFMHWLASCLFLNFKILSSWWQILKKDQNFNLSYLFNFVAFIPLKSSRTLTFASLFHDSISVSPEIGWFCQLNKTQRNMICYIKTATCNIQDLFLYF